MRCEGGQKARCSYCMSDLATGGGNTSGLKKHLKTKHPRKFKEFSKEAEERERIMNLMRNLTREKSLIELMITRRKLMLFLEEISMRMIL